MQSSESPTPPIASSSNTSSSAALQSVNSSGLDYATASIVSANYTSATGNTAYAIDNGK